MGSRPAYLSARRTRAFRRCVANGKRNMPAWDDVLDPEQIEALWAYVIAGEAGE